MILATIHRNMSRVQQQQLGEIVVLYRTFQGGFLEYALQYTTCPHIAIFVTNQIMIKWNNSEFQLES